MLLHEIAPLMQWRNLGGNETAHKFDLLTCRLQTELLKKSSSFDDLKGTLQGQLDDLRMNLSQVRAVAPLIVNTRGNEFWSNVTVEKLESVRQTLRGVMQFRENSGGGGSLPPKVIDVSEDSSLVERQKYEVKLDGLQRAAYRNRVEKVLKDLFENNETLKRIKAGQPVEEKDLGALTSLVLTQDPQLDLTDLMDYYPEFAGHLDLAIRGIIGLDAVTVSKRFTHFVQKHPTLNSAQIQFLEMLQNHISKYGSVEIERLYEAPFTSVHTDSLDGLFQDEDQIGSLIDILHQFQPSGEGKPQE